jgi:catechol 2,3-dioxygenase-like lactoylglutathione lyase family enzyme
VRVETSWYGTGRLREAASMLAHFGINVPDLVEAKRYYDQIMPLLGFVEYLSADDQFAYCPANGKPGTYLFFYPALEAADYSRHRTGLQHLAFRITTRSGVDALHQRVQDLGSPVIAAPRQYPEYEEHYYATFWSDPFGFMLEAVCLHDRA